MRELFEKFRSYSIVSIIVSALCGLALLIFPEASIRYISLAFGGALLIMGAVGVVQYFRKTAGPVALSAGLISMVCGVIVCAKYQSILTLVEFLFGASIFCGGIIGLVIALRREMRLLPGWGVNLALTMVSIIFGIVCMVHHGDIRQRQPSHAAGHLHQRVVAPAGHGEGQDAGRGAAAVCSDGSCGLCAAAQGGPRCGGRSESYGADH